MIKGVWTATLALGEAIGHWVEKHPGTAGWMQAGGAILALGTAIYVPWRQRHNQISDEKRIAYRRGRGIALSLWAHVDTMLDDVISNIDMLNPKTKSNADDLVIQIPLRIDSVLHDLYLAGEPGISLQRAVGYVEYLNGQLDRGIYNPSADEDREYLRSCYVQMRDILKSVKRNFGLSYQVGDRELGGEAELRREKIIH